MLIWAMELGRMCRNDPSVPPSIRVHYCGGVCCVCVVVPGTHSGSTSSNGFLGGDGGYHRVPQDFPRRSVYWTILVLLSVGGLSVLSHHVLANVNNVQGFFFFLYFFHFPPPFGSIGFSLSFSIPYLPLFLLFPSTSWRWLLSARVLPTESIL
ncbi:hypothetical protein BO71DRAFT_39156 [Aspergillus ellipticus CBS 707.79]|uniref:Uncharacterized protein n=1 Tax=Aspergillus ellipticus CBS 707.79 TaxID=1448320 RepID=A0A319DUJ6_9EURO|nr:hypothetical protein BO71DRAFT_39156 [Aspergillus ellipticus CBS 707.79]